MSLGGTKQHMKSEGSGSPRDLDGETEAGELLRDFFRAQR